MARLARSEACLGSTPFAVLDVETTGFSANGSDRIVEIAVLRLTPNGALCDEFVTLVNPDRDVGPTNIHGIRATDVVHAPRFGDIAGDVAQRLDGAIVVGHNVRFDLLFLGAEFRRAGSSLPPLPSLCTLRLAHRLLDGAASRKLVDCCAAAGVPYEAHHFAASDAKATAGLLAHYLKAGRRCGWETLRDYGCDPTDVPDSSWVRWPPSGRSIGRRQAADTAREERGFLATLVSRMPGDRATDADQASYMALLDRALEDRQVTPQEAKALVGLAVTSGMSRADVNAAHLAYVEALATTALADGVVSAAERTDLMSVAELLGITSSKLDSMLAAPKRRRTGAARESLKGRSVCFTGTLSGRLRGELITREMAEDLAARAGLKVATGVTMDLDLLVVADPNTQSGKAAKARKYGTRIMAEAAFWASIAVPAE